MVDFLIALFLIGLIVGIPLLLYLRLQAANYTGTAINKGVIELENSLGEKIPTETSKEAKGNLTKQT